jgi:hypothetical protein
MNSRRTTPWRYVTPALLLAVIGGCAQPDLRPETALLERPYRYSDRDWARVLQAYARNGLVDYEGLAAHSQDLDRYYALISVTGPSSTPDQFPTRAAMTAYWINAFNAMVLKAVLVRYPTKSMYDLAMPRLETEYSFKVDGRIRTPAAGEAEMLAVSGNDVRTLFATSRAALGTPALPAQPMTADFLDRQLTTAAAQALDDARIMRIDPATHSIHLWQMILRRQGDFEEYWRSRRRASTGKLLDALVDLASPKRRQTLHAAVGYTFSAIQFDRSLNSTHQKSRVP